MKLEPKKYYWVTYTHKNKTFSELIRINVTNTYPGYYSFYSFGCDEPSHVTDENLVDYKEVVNPFPNTIEV